MPHSKIKNFFNSFRNKVLLIVSLALIAGILLLTKFFLVDNSNPNDNTSEVNINNEKSVEPDLNSLRSTLDANIDSILYTFGIKKDWITTSTKSADSKQTKNQPGSEWFSKTVLIPADLSSIEVNLDLSSYINSTGLLTSTTEDIISRDITISVLSPDTSKTGVTLAKINVTHSDKITRESAMICLILNNIGDYSEEELSKLVMDKSEFSFVFPRSLDDIDIQNKLLQNKKDVIINLKAGAADNYDADFNSGIEEKTARDKVISFSKDFPTIGNVILAKVDDNIPRQTLDIVTGEFNKFNIQVIKDTALTTLLAPAEENSKDKIASLFNNLRIKSSIIKNIISLVTIDADEFESFYDNVLVMKKMGYKFYNLSDYLAKILRQKQKDEKLKAEEDKKSVTKKPVEKKTVDKKSTDKKPVEKKKTETKKPETKKPTTNDKKKK